MAALEYEVREEYKDYTVAQLLESPVTCFQGVGEIQSEMLQRYFNVTTVRELAHFSPFLQALSVQETVLEGGAVIDQSVADAARDRQLGFAIRGPDQTKRVVELPNSPVHVLDGLTPGQDLALYDAFRITSLGHLAHNRIMLEARVIEYLAEHGDSVASTDAPNDAVSAILGARAAQATTAQQRARAASGDESHRMQSMASDASEHVRDRVAAMRDRTQDRAAERTAAGRGGGGAEGAAALGSATSRIDAIRQGRERGVRGREAPAHRSAGASRTDEILASRSGAGRDLSGRPGASSSRADAVMAARGTNYRDTPSSAPSGGAMVRTRGSGGGAATATATAAGAAAGGTAAGGDTTLRTEEEAAAAAATADAARTRRPQPRPNPAPIIAAAAVVILLIAALLWFLLSGGEPEPTPTTAGTDQTTSDSATGTAGAQSGTTAGTDTTTAPPPPPRIKGTHTVRSGDTLWFISEKEYADPLNWPSIFRENQDQISNPDLIHPEQQFRIPTDPEYRFPQYPEGYRRSR